jgi:AcrR family transcriptional regulator
MKPSMKDILKQEKTETVRNAILDAADSIIKNEGVEKISIRKVAAIIGYSPGSIYQYFSDKDSLINNAIMRGYQRLMKSVKDAKSEESHVPKVIESRFVSYVEAVLESPIYYTAVMFSDKTAVLEHTRILDEDATKKRAIFKELIETIETGMNEGSIRKGSPLIIAQIIWSAVFGILTRSILESVNKELTIERIKEAILRII